MSVSGEAEAAMGSSSSSAVHTIGLLVSHSPDRRLLSEFLRDAGYRVYSPELEEPHLELLSDASVIIADEGAARALGERLLAMKSPWGMVLSLIITMPPRVAAAPWLRFGFDDVLRLPITKAELAARLAALLRLREQWNVQQRTMEELRRARDELEQGVFDRTAELTASNQALRDEIAQRKRVERALSKLSGRLLKLRDEEQRRIGRELHDSTSQNLAALAMSLAMVQRADKRLDAKAKKALAESIELVDQCSQEIRTLSYLLHPPLLDEVGLSAAIHWYAAGFARRSKVHVDVEVSPEFGRLPANMEHALFRTVQESLINVYRHAGSEKARIRLTRNDAGVVLEVMDEGHGMTTHVDGEDDRGVGIMGMQERMRELGGDLYIRSRSTGTTVEATLPLPQAET